MVTNYTPTHSATDISGVAVDILVEYGVQIVALSAVVALASVYVWVRNSISL